MKQRTEHGYQVFTYRDSDGVWHIFTEDIIVSDDDAAVSSRLDQIHRFIDERL